VKVDPITPTLKPNGIKRLKLMCATLLSNSASKFILRRYSEVGKQARVAAEADRRRRQQLGKVVHVDPIKPKLKLPGTQRLKLKRDRPV